MATLMKNAWEEIQTKNRNKGKRPNQLLPNIKQMQKTISKPIVKNPKVKKKLLIYYSLNVIFNLLPDRWLLTLKVTNRMSNGTLSQEMEISFALWKNHLRHSRGEYFTKPL